MKSYIGILGDPAKSELYDEQFYSILNWDESGSSFQLLGASEDDVSKNAYQLMFNKISTHVRKSKFTPIPGLSRRKDTSYRTRVGLFPSSTSHLIRGPSFSFAPFPVNSSSWYLKFKSNFLQFILRPFLPFVIRKLAYVPLGGKAANKTNADRNMTHNDLPDIFSELRRGSNFDWYYLEAGSGQDFLPYTVIEGVMKAQLPTSVNFDLLRKSHEPGTRLVIPRFIYGGGIKSISDLDQLIAPDPHGVKLIPECVIVGNISEEDISVTYELVERVSEFNSGLTLNVNSH